MEFTVEDQLIIAVASLIYGFSTAFLFDISRVLRKVKKAGTVLVSIEDIIFWIIAAVTAFLFILKFNFGIIRFFMLPFALIGAFLYFKLLSRYVVKLMLFICEYIRRLFFLIIKIMVFPFKLLRKIFKKPLYIIINVSKCSFKRIKGKISKKAKLFYKFKDKIQIF